MHVPSFALPWEVGMYWDLTVGGLNKRAMGCPGLDTPFGSVVDDQYNWPEKRNSQTMKCGLNMVGFIYTFWHSLSSTSSLRE